MPFTSLLKTQENKSFSLNRNFTHTLQVKGENQPPRYRE